MGRSNDIVLAHYGVKGMRWGKRKTERTTAKAEKKAAAEAAKSDDHKSKTALKGKKLETLSNDDLKKLNERMQLEQNYMRLMKSDPSSVSKGQARVDAILNSVNAGVDVIEFATSPEVKMVASIIGGAIKTAKSR